MGNEDQPGPICSDDPLPCILGTDDGTTCRGFSPTPGPTEEPPAGDAHTERIQRALGQIAHVVDLHEELRGAGISVMFPDETAYLLRESNHPSFLATFVEVEVSGAAPGGAEPLAAHSERGWWDQWGGVVLNCGGATLAVGGLVASIAASGATLGVSAPVAVLAYAGATASGAQCGLAVARATSGEFEDYVQSDEGEWVSYVEIALDVIALAGSAQGAVQAVETGAGLLQASRYSRLLSRVPAARLGSTIRELERNRRILGYFGRVLQRMRDTGRLSGRIVRGSSAARAMRTITGALRREELIALSSAVGAAVTAASSNESGTISVSLRFLQESVFGGDDPEACIDDDFCSVN